MIFHKLLRFLKQTFFKLSIHSQKLGTIYFIILNVLILKKALPLRELYSKPYAHNLRTCNNSLLPVVKYIANTDGNKTD